MTSRLALFVLGVSTTLAACDFAHGSEPDYGYEGVPRDLKVRQVPANPVRAGTLVTFTATYGDRLHHPAYVSWDFQDGSHPFGRTVEWRAPMVARTYQNGVSVLFEGFPSASRGFVTVVVP